MVWARRRGHSQRFATALEDLRNRTGFRVSAEVVEQILADLGES
jgi:predicted nucleic acid-binding protein